MTRYQVSYSSFAPPQEPGLQPYFARGAYQRRNNTSGCLLAPFCHHFESAALPDSRPLTLAAPYAVLTNVRPSASISFDPVALPEAVVVTDGPQLVFVAFEAAATATRLSLELVALARGSTMPPGCPDGDACCCGDGSKAVMSLCCGSISSSFRAPAGARPTVLRASTAPGKPHRRRAASGRTRRPPAAPAARRLREHILQARPRTSHPLLRLTRRSRKRRAEPPSIHP